MSTRSSPRASSGTSTASTSGASSWVKSLQTGFSKESGNGPGNLQPQHPQVPEDGGSELAARDRAGGAEVDPVGQAERRRIDPGEVHPRDPVPRRAGAFRRRDPTKIVS